MSLPAAALILVVEDDPDLRADIVEELEEAGYGTAAAPDGAAALKLLSEIRPDLVLCDITMPGLDGYDLLAALRDGRPELAATPFVFLTARSGPREVVEGKLMGADDYLVKPVDYDLMLATVAARLRQVDRIHQSQSREIDDLRRTLAGLSGGGAERALDLIALGVVLLDGGGKVLHANRAARAMAARGDFVTLGHDRIEARQSSSRRMFRQVVSDMLQAAATEAEHMAGAVLERAGDDLTASVLACTLPRPAADAGEAPRVALFLSAPARERRVSESLLADLFGLTPTEARVAATLAGGARPAGVAAALGVSQTTIAFHMRNLFQKTGTNRQTDLVALILAGPMMIDQVTDGS